MAQDDRSYGGGEDGLGDKMREPVSDEVCSIRKLII